MGLFDKAAERFKRSGEETIRIVDYDALPEEEEVEAPKPAAPKRVRAPKPKLGDLLTKPKAKAADASDLDDLSQDDSDDGKFPIIEDTAFTLDEDEPNFYEQAQSAWEEQEKNRPPTFEPLPEKGRGRKKGKAQELEYDEQKIADVLEVLRIPATFAIHADVLMPEDFPSIDFDLQMPQGYDIGQVEFFVERSEATVREYMKLLEKRNEHIALLATTIDRLQVDLQNLKYDNQIAAGIGIMPTSDNDDLERENVELKLRIKKLEDDLRARSKDPVLTSEEREMYEGLRDQYSVLQRDNNDLREQIQTLKTKLAQVEEAADDPTWMPDLSRLDSVVDDDDTEDAFELPSVLPEPPAVTKSPVARESTPLPLPNPGTAVPQSTPKPMPLVDDDDIPGSAFSFDDDDDYSFLQKSNDHDSSADPTIEQPRVSSYDDEDDDLEKLMKDWGTN